MAEVDGARDVGAEELADEVGLADALVVPVLEVVPAGGSPAAPTATGASTGARFLIRRLRLKCSRR